MQVSPAACLCVAGFFVYQSAMALALVPVAVIDWSNSFTLLTMMLFGHAVIVATRDVAIDTLAIRSAPIEELGRINSWIQGGMLAGRAAGASGALLLVLVTLSLLALPL